MAVIFCPYCGSLNVKLVGVSGAGSIFYCAICKARFLCAERNEDGDDY